MKLKNIIIILISVFFSCCIRKEVSIYDLQEESLNTGIRIDTIFGNMVFNCTDSDVYKSLNIKAGDKYIFPVTELKYYYFEVDPHFFNDSLYEVEFILSNENIINELENVYKLKYGNPDTTITSKLNEPYFKEIYWLNHNLQIKITSLSSENINRTSIYYTDLSRKTIGPGIISNENYNSFWTEKYYNDVYLPKKKKILKGI